MRLSGRHVLLALLVACLSTNVTIGAETRSDAAAEIRRKAMLYRCEIHDKSRENLQRLAAEGNADAEYCIARQVHRDGRIDEAEKWYRRAAIDGSVKAQGQLAEFLEHKNLKESLYWYARAGCGGHDIAQLVMATKSYKMLPEPKNVMHAYFWWRIGGAPQLEFRNPETGELRHPHDGHLPADLVERLSADQKKKADRWVAYWRTHRDTDTPCPVDVVPPDPRT